MFNEVLLRLRGQAYANGLRRKYPRPGDQWHLDERAIITDNLISGHPSFCFLNS